MRCAETFKYKMVLYHRNIVQHVINSKYHLFEHFFLAIISQTLKKYQSDIIDIYGNTTNTKTNIYICYRYEIAEELVDKCIKKMKALGISRKLMIREVLKVNNEIRYINEFNQKKYQIFSTEKISDFKDEILAFYFWREVKIDLLNSSVSVNTSNQVIEFIDFQKFQQSRHKLYYDVFELMIIKPIIGYEREIVLIKEPQEVIIYIQINDSQREMYSDNINNTMYLHFSRKLFTNFFHQELRKIDNKNFIMIYTFINIKQEKIACHHLFKIMKEVLNWEIIEVGILNKSDILKVIKYYLSDSS